jgi:hypothetical protein
MRTLLPVLIFLAISLHPKESQANSNLCRKGEINFSSCSVGKKIASFCTSSKNVSSPYIQYRFGTPEKLEFVFPANGTKSKEIVFFNSSGVYTDGSEGRLSFKSGKYQYIFFHIDSRHGDSSGIHVLKDGKLVKDLPCTNPTADQISIPEGLIGNEEFFWFD